MGTRIEWHYTAPNRLQRNAFIKSFDETDDEVLNKALFTLLPVRL